MVGSICLSAFSRCAVVCASQAPRDAPGLLPGAGAFAFSPLLAALAEQRHALANLNSAMVRPCWSAQCRRGSFYRLCSSFSRFICSFVNHRRILGEVVDAARCGTVQGGCFSHSQTENRRFEADDSSKFCSIGDSGDRWNFHHWHRVFVRCFSNWRTMMLLCVRFGRSLPRMKSHGMRREVYLASSATRFFAYEGEADVKSIEELVLGNKGLRLCLCQLRIVYRHFRSDF